MNRKELKEFLDEKVLQYHSPQFVESDPIQIPHYFSLKEDIEISGLLASLMAWGNRKMIISKSKDLMERMGNSPYDFVMNYSENQFQKIQDFKYRTINSDDLDFFIRSLQNIYSKHNGLETVFSFSDDDSDSFNPIENFRNKFFETPHLHRSEKHISSPAKNSAAKRINMFLRWMVRENSQGVDFGIWKNISSAQLVCPLDVHSGAVARKLGLLKRKQNDWKAAIELNDNLKKMDESDPVKYDFALFGLGVFENFTKN